MKQLIENMIFDKRIIKLEDKVPVLKYLKENNFKFTLSHIEHQEFEMLKNKENWKAPLIKDYKGLIAGYSSNIKDEISIYFRQSGGLKISDNNSEIPGSFIIEDKRIIYDSTIPFYEERDRFVYFGNEFYTHMSMIDILKEELEFDKECLIYMGRIRNGCRYEVNLQKISKEELLEYAKDKEKCKTIKKTLY